MPTVMKTLPRFISRDDETAASIALGPDHALVRLFALRRALAWQIAVTSLPLLFGIVGTTRHVVTAPIVLGAAALVELVLMLAVLFVRQRIRACAHELIASGHDGLRLSIVMSERRRLLSHQKRESLARSLERYLHDAQHWHRIFPASRPPQGVRALRFAAAEVHDIVALLRADPVGAPGVALSARFLTDGGASPLFAGDVVKLRAELNRIRELLGAPSRMSHSAPEDRLAA